jgi:bifunctional oligoribonuclease and PAP phosphatase NrnA
VNIPEKLISLISENNLFLVVSHERPDCDAYGSSCGLTLILRELEKEAYCLNSSGVVPRFQFIPEVENTYSEIPKLITTRIHETVLIYCDCATKARIGDIDLNSLNFKNTINIDHHISNEKFAEVNWVEPKSSSTCEMIFEFLKSFSLSYNINISTCLFAGLVADTGSFQYSLTSSNTLRVAANLLDSGAQHTLIMKSLFSSKISSGNDFPN